MLYGLKIWSINTDYYLEEARRLYKENHFDYIELYVVPNTLESLNLWKKLRTEENIPFLLHAPHFKHKLNLADKSREDFNFKIYEEVRIFSQELEAENTVVHCGIEGDINETICQLKKIVHNNEKHYLIENKPHKAPFGNQELCRGANIEEIKQVLTEINCGFCLDIGHAFCTANSLNYEPYSFLEKFNKLNPTCYHLSDNDIKSTIDAHMHIEQGNIDFKKVFNIIDKTKKIAIETNKDSKTDLNDFIQDKDKLKKYEI